MEESLPLDTVRWAYQRLFAISRLSKGFFFWPLRLKVTPKLLKVFHPRVLMSA